MTTTQAAPVAGPVGWTHMVRSALTNRRSRSETPGVTRYIAQFVLAGLIALVALTVASLVASRQAGTDEAVRDAKNRTAVLARTVVWERLTPELLAGDADALAGLDSRMRGIIESESFAHVRIWASDGSIVYSDEPGLTGTVLELGEEAIHAFETREVVAEVSDLEEAENANQRSEGRLLEVYRPMTAIDGTPVLFETYDAFERVDESARQIWLRFLPAVLIPLGLLQLVQIPFAVRLARKVEHSEKERSELLQHVIAASDSERRGIAHDLHDGAVQDLAGVGYALSVVSDRAATSGDHRSVELLDGVQIDVRRSIKSLRSLFVEIYPPNLQRSGLEVALSDLLAAVGGRGIDARLSYPEALELPPEINRIVYRIAQEATRNVVRHADATDLDVEVEEVPGGVTLRVADNGNGFNPNRIDELTEAGHLGLRLMTDLASEAGGRLDIYAKPGVGTDLRLQLPR